MFWGFDVLIVLLLIALNGFFAMSEFALVSARKARLQQSAEEGNPRALAALELANAPNQFLSTVQIGITLIGVLSGAFGGATLAHKFGGFLARYPLLEPYSDSIALGSVVVVITYLSLLGELVPKRLALSDPERIAARVAGFMHILSKIAYPVIRLLSVSTEFLLKFRRAGGAGRVPITEEEIKILIGQATVAGVFEEAEKEMVQRVFRLGDRRAGSLMTPRQKIEWIDLGESSEKNRRKILNSPFSRYPVCQGKLSNVLGVLHVKALLNRNLSGQSVDLRSLVEQPLFVHENMHVLNVMESLRKSGTQMALVIDEYGTIEGLVTFNDILEAIVGEIPSLDQLEEPRIVRRKDGSYLVDGMLPADEVKELFNIRKLPGEGLGYYETLGGFVMTYLRRVPSEGDSFSCCGLSFEVVDMDGHRVDKVLVKPLEPDDRGEETPAE
ncbi:MAG: hemolysin family protein [Syntrophobacteraceae bacterium]|nr:hemolysin family protein [Desulfobacteraceae bacterium]